MKLLTLLLAFLFSISALGSYPIGFKGQLGTGKQYPSVIETPYKQITKTSGSVALVETGNKNRLQNPGMEDTNTSNGWSTSCTGTANPTPSAETTNPIEGKKSLIYTISGGASGGVCNIYQDADTFYALDGIVSMYVKSDTQAGVVFIKRANGAEAVRFDPNASDTYRDIVSNPVLFKIPGAMGTTSTGVGVEVTVAASQTIVVTMDEAKVGLEDVKTDATRIESQSVKASAASGTTVDLSTGTSSGSGLFSVSGGTLTALKDINVSASVSSSATSSVSGESVFASMSGGSFSSSDLGRSTGAGQIVRASSSSDVTLQAGNQLTLAPSATGTMTSPNHSYTIVATTADNTELFPTAADFFSTDTNTLAFKATAITDSDPVGTFNTYSYAINTNTKTICGTAPTQTTADMKTNGVLIYARAYNAASTCGNPARVEFKIAKAGTSLPTLSREMFANTGKSLPLDMNFTLLTTTQSYGITYDLYDPSTGILVVDAGINLLNTNTAHSFLKVDGGSSVLSGYLVINAQPKKTTAVADFAEFDYVYVRATSDFGRSVGTSSTDIVFEDEEEDTKNAYNPVTGVFTMPDGPRKICSIKSSMGSASVTLATNQRFQAILYVNGVLVDACERSLGGGAAQNHLSKCSADLPLSGGDEVKIAGVSSVATTLDPNGYNANFTVMCIPGQFR